MKPKVDRLGYRIEPSRPIGWYFVIVTVLLASFVLIARFTG